MRRGRCGRIFAKYVQKSIFEDQEGGTGNASDNEDEKSGAAPTLKKRRKRYQDLYEYLYLDGNGANENSVYQGLLLRD